MIERPKLREDVLSREVEDELLLYDPRTGETLLLNNTAAAIVELCDGSTSPAGIVDEIVSVVEVDRAQVEADVRKLIHDLGERGFVEEAR
jgi:PqqD family protein of HPr-rel-A system